MKADEGDYALFAGAKSHLADLMGIAGRFPAQKRRFQRCSGNYPDCTIFGSQATSRKPQVFKMPQLLWTRSKQETTTTIKEEYLS